MTNPTHNDPVALKACPFCGGEAFLQHKTDVPVIFGWCQRCAAHGPGLYTDEEAIAAWNTRAPVGDVAVTQADRDAAIDLVSPQEAQRISAGTCDDHQLVQAFAAHRIAALPSPEDAGEVEQSITAIAKAAVKMLPLSIAKIERDVRISELTKDEMEILVWGIVSVITPKTVQQIVIAGDHRHFWNDDAEEWQLPPQPATLTNTIAQNEGWHTIQPIDRELLEAVQIVAHRMVHYQPAKAALCNAERPVTEHNDACVNPTIDKAQPAKADEVRDAAHKALGEWLSWPDAGRDGPRKVTDEQVISWLGGVAQKLAALKG